MSTEYSNEPMLDMFLFETYQLLEQLEQSILICEKSKDYCPDSINEIFRIMHTIKGSSAMMMFNPISTLAHSIEDLFFYLREEKGNDLDQTAISDMVLAGVDFIKIEMEKIKNGDQADGDASDLIKRIKSYLSHLKKDAQSVLSLSEYQNQQQKAIPQAAPRVSLDRSEYKVLLRFEDDCGMENIRAFSVIHELESLTREYSYDPGNIDGEASNEIIRQKGFTIYLHTDKSYDDIQRFFMETPFLKTLELVQSDGDLPLNSVSENLQTQMEILEKSKQKKHPAEEKEPLEKEGQHTPVQQSIVSVNVSKLDKLMDLVGEMVIAEAMVIQNPDLKGLELDNFQKAAQRLKKITGEIQDMVMSVRMVSLSTTFHKMQRIVRDMCKKLGKEVELEIIGEETEVDKNIIEHISDPLMHLVRNALDHGIGSPEERIKLGKNDRGAITLEAKNSGGDVLILVKDNGRGLCKEKILKKARDNGLLSKTEQEMSDREIFNLIFLPGFSTKDTVTEFSGRGVGMDVVTRNIQAIGGSVFVDSEEGKGTTMTLKIPLTLAIIDGMIIKVGDSSYTLPIISIKESFRPKENEVITDPDGREMIMVRGQCYPILRLHQLYKVKTNITHFSKGIFIMVEQDGKTLCVFADELIGQQQVVVKALPDYIRGFKKIQGLAGCTLLGDGSISLILDIGGLMQK